MDGVAKLHRKMKRSKLAGQIDCNSTCYDCSLNFVYYTIFMAPFGSFKEEANCSERPLGGCLIAFNLITIGKCLQQYLFQILEKHAAYSVL